MMIFKTTKKLPGSVRSQRASTCDTVQTGPDMTSDENHPHDKSTAHFTIQCVLYLTNSLQQGPKANDFQLSSTDEVRVSSKYFIKTNKTKPKGRGLCELSVCKDIKTILL